MSAVYDQISEPRPLCPINLSLSQCIDKLTEALIKSILGEAQFDPELAGAFRERWIMPRREMAKGVIERAIAEGSLRACTNADTIVDLLYAPLYYRLQMGTGPLTDAYADELFHTVVDGIHARP